jgi:hypothetical protein
MGTWHKNTTSERGVFFPQVTQDERTFKKGYLPNWTEELFTVVKCIETRPPVYLVKDDHGEFLEGTCYAEEIQKVMNTTSERGDDFPQVTHDDILSVSLGAIRKTDSLNRDTSLL